MTTNNTPTNKHFRQLILLNTDVQFVKSDDVIFSTENIKDTAFEKWFPCLESIYENLRNLKPEDGELIYSRIVCPAEFLPGSYDFSFAKKRLDGREYILWSIYDYSVIYSHLTKYQQLKNEKDIFRQKLEYKNRNVQNINELFS